VLGVGPFVVVIVRQMLRPSTPHGSLALTILAEASFLDVDHFDEKERYPHHIRTPRLIKAFCFSQLMSYDDPARFSLNPVSKMPVVPAEVRQFAARKDRADALPNIEIPSFLKRGPRTEEDDNSWA
jgi:hypothetical protein